MKKKLLQRYHKKVKRQLIEQEKIFTSYVSHKRLVFRMQTETCNSELKDNNPNKKLVEGYTWTFPQNRYTNDQQEHEKLFNISHQGSANQNHNQIPHCFH